MNWKSRKEEKRKTQGRNGKEIGRDKANEF